MQKTAIAALLAAGIVLAALQIRASQDAAALADSRGPDCVLIASLCMDHYTPPPGPRYAYEPHTELCKAIGVKDGVNYSGGLWFPWSPEMKGAIDCRAFYGALEQTGHYSLLMRMAASNRSHI